ncbi:PH domain-containing protein [Salinibacterium hongtaonis]|uniref:YdbS-like PH domain-containing protein n=1 Tax=Homoserinimonas hongtaonis TaxID=2079791 RepID=A0A2U1SWN1_9MICO|nr:PH domain-containing protein [Salinibacterium hongtaonis]PWB96006.1 hypothetical protein DF220_11440 [Salinibacterium hongtaonis]
MATDTDGAAINGERVVARLRPHARALFWPSLLLIVGGGTLAYFSNVFPEEWQNVALVGVGGLLLALLWLIPLFRWLSTRYTVTTRRLVMRRGLFTRIRQEILHSRGYDVTLSRGALQSMFRSGDVIINAGLEQPLVLRDVPSADLVHDALHDLMERNMNPRGHAASAAGDETTAYGVR